MRSVAHTHPPRVHDSPIHTTTDHRCFPPVTESDHNSNPNTPKPKPFSKPHFTLEPHFTIENLTPSQPDNQSAASTPSHSLSSPSMTGRTSISSVSDSNVFTHRMPSSITTTTSQQEHIPCDASSRDSVTSERTLSNPRFAQPTSSSLKRTEKVNHPNPKPNHWTPSLTKPKSPLFRCVGKVSAFSATIDTDKSSVKSSCTESSNNSSDTSRANKSPALSATVPKTPNVLRRKSFCHRTSTTPEQLNRAFVPNPIPRYLKTGNLPDIKQTRKSMQLADIRNNPGRVVKHEAPRKVVPPGFLEPTKAKPFALGSVVKHEERMHQIKQRIAAEEEEDRKRREFRPVTLRPEILRGPTFVPRKGELPLTTPVDLLPNLRERSERTLAFEARQRARMEDLERNKLAAEEERDKLVEERLRKEYESRRFKSRPVPESHYKPHIPPVKKSQPDDRTSESHSSHSEETQAPVNSFDKSLSEGEKLYDEEPDSDHNTESPLESKAVSILQGIRKSLSLSPLLGRGSTSPS